MFLCEGEIVALGTNNDSCEIFKNQSEFVWKGKKAAVVLTYDDGLNDHLDNVLPALEQMGFKATFYVFTGSEDFQERIDDWQNLALKGHEIGNHSVYHPCPDMFSPDKKGDRLPDINQYSVESMLMELRMANAILKDLDGQEERTYAYPCGHKYIGDTLYSGFLLEDFIAGRGIIAKSVAVDDHNLYDLGAFMIYNRASLEMLINLTNRIIDRGRLVIFVFHGVGGGHEINMDTDQHYQFLQYLKSREDELWITTLREAVEYMQLFSKD